MGIEGEGKRGRENYLEIASGFLWIRKFYSCGGGKGRFLFGLSHASLERKYRRRGCITYEGEIIHGIR